MGRSVNHRPTSHSVLWLMSMETITRNTFDQYAYVIWGAYIKCGVFFKGWGTRDYSVDVATLMHSLERNAAALAQSVAKLGRPLDGFSNVVLVPAVTAAHSATYQLLFAYAEGRGMPWEDMEQSSYWDCYTCQVRNNIPTEECVACQTPNPTSKSIAPLQAQLAPVLASAKLVSAPAQLVLDQFAPACMLVKLLPTAQPAPVLH